MWSSLWGVCRRGPRPGEAWPCPHTAACRCPGRPGGVPRGEGRPRGLSPSTKTAGAEERAPGLPTSHGPLAPCVPSWPVRAGRGRFGQAPCRRTRLPLPAGAAGAPVCSLDRVRRLVSSSCLSPPSLLSHGRRRHGEARRAAGLSAEGVPAVRSDSVLVFVVLDALQGQGGRSALGELRTPVPGGQARPSPAIGSARAAPRVHGDEPFEEKQNPECEGGILTTAP